MNEGVDRVGRRWRPGGSVGAWALLLLPACTQVNPRPDFDRAHELIEASTGYAEVYDPDRPELTAEQIAAIADDGLSLDEAVRLTLVNNRQLQAAFMEIGVARAEWVQSGLLSNPSVDVMFRFPLDGGRSQVEATLAQNLLELWRIPVRRKISQHRLDETVLRIARLAGELVEQAKSAYDEAVAAEDLYRIAEENAGIVGQSLEAVRSMQEAGAASGFDENLARGRSLAARLAARTARIDAVDARRRLARVLSLDRDIVLTDPLPDPVAPPRDPETLVEQARTSRLDLQALAAVVDAAAVQLELERSRAWGEVAAGPSVERPAGSGDSQVGAGFSLELPIFDQNQAGVAAARYLYRRARKTLEGARLAVAQDIRTAADRTGLAASSADFYRDELLPQAERNLEFAEQSFAAGRSNVLFLFDAQQSLLEARRGYVGVRLDLARALADLERAVGLPAQAVLEPPAPAP